MDRQQNTMTNSRHAGDGTRDSDALLRDIERTRDAMDHTLDELGDRLHPRQLMDDAVDLFRSDSPAGRKFRRTTKRWSRIAADEVRDNPFPALLIGAGVAWMVFNSRRDDEDELYYPDADAYEHRYETHISPGAAEFGVDRTDMEYDENTMVGACGLEAGAHPTGEEINASLTLNESTEEKEGRMSRAGHAAKEKAEQAGHSIRHGAGRAKGAVSDAAYSARRGIARGANRTSAGMHRMSASAKRRARRVRGRVTSGAHETYDYSREQFEEAVDEYPIAVAAGALGLGLLIGALIPRTRPEDRFMGDAADDVKRTAVRYGEEAAQRGRQVAKATAQATAEEMERQGLTADELTQRSRRVADETREAFDEALHEEGLTPEEMKEKVKHVADEAGKTAKSETKAHAKEMKDKSDKETVIRDAPRDE